MSFLNMEKFNEKFSGYYDYLNEIWKRLYNLVIFFIVFFAAGFLCSGQILKYVVKFFDLKNATIVTTSPFQFFDLAMTVGIYTGFILCVPVFLFHLYKFMKDGLRKKEKKFFFVLLPIGIALFCGGFAYGTVILNYTLNSIAVINLDLGIKNFWDIGVFLTQIVFTSMLLGLLFQFPICLLYTSPSPRD